MSAKPTFDLLLLGYRNDLAREHTLARLRRLAVRYPVDAVDRDTPLPHPILTGIDHDFGLDLCAQLRQDGAQVRLVASEPLRSADPPPSPVRRGLPVRTLVLLLLLAAAAALQATLNRGDNARRPGDAGDSVLGMPDPRHSEGGTLQSQRLNSEAIALSEDGDFAGAAERLRNAIHGEPDQPTLRQNLRVVLHNWAVAELNDGRPENAIKLIEQALELGEDRNLLLVLGVGCSRTGDLARARTALERALALGANDAQTFLALGRVYQEDGNREGAVEMFQRARDLGVTDPQFNIALQRLERELDAEWGYTELASPHFTISFAEGKNYAAARHVQESLEQAYFTVGRKFDYYPQQRTPVVLYDSEEFHDVTQAPRWMGALYDGRIKLPVRGLEQGNPILDRTIRHEYAHAIVSELSHGRCPVWLNEGLAIWAEETVDGERSGPARAAVADQELFFLDDLRRPFTEIPAARIGVAYAQSYLAVRRLLDDFGSQDVRALLTALGSGNPLPQAFESVFSRSLADFESGFVRSLTG